MSTFSAGICPRISGGKVEILCLHAEAAYFGIDRYVFPGNKNEDPEDTPQEILEKVFPLQTGLRVVSSRLVFFDRVEDRYFWLVTEFDDICAHGCRLELLDTNELVWTEVSELRRVIFKTHQIGLTRAIKTLARLKEDFSIPLYDACPELFRTK